MFDSLEWPFPLALKKENHVMKIVVVGAGGVGGYFGARLALSGEDVTFVQRGPHFKAMQKNGLRVESTHGDVVLDTVKVTDNPTDIGPVDIVLIAVKSGETEEAAELCRPLLSQKTGVITLQNGVENETRLTDKLGHAHVLGGVVYILSLIVSPGVIRHSGDAARLVFGELDGSRSDRAQVFLESCRNASIDAHLSEEIGLELWKKFIFLCPHNGMTALTRCSIGLVREDLNCRKLLQGAAEEVIAVATAHNIPISTDEIGSLMNRFDGLPPEMTSSMHYDVINGKPLELDWLSGAVVRLGNERSVATPINEFIYAALKLLRGGANG